MLSLLIYCIIPTVVSGSGWDEEGLQYGECSLLSWQGSGRQWWWWDCSHCQSQVLLHPGQLWPGNTGLKTGPAHQPCVSGSKTNSGRSSLLIRTVWVSSAPVLQISQVIINDMFKKIENIGSLLFPPLKKKTPTIFLPPVSSHWAILFHNLLIWSPLVLCVQGEEINSDRRMDWKVWRNN